MLQDLNGKTIKRIEHFALAIVRRSQNQNHCAICYKDGNGDAWLMHLAWHYRLHSDYFPLHYQWSEVKRHKSILKHLAVICELIRTQNDPMPYGFDRTGIKFDPNTGKATIPSGGKGLTCATFIITVFETQLLTLLKEEEWPSDANVEWQNAMLAELELTSDVDEAYVKAVSEHVGHVRRFSPEEVVGSAAEAAWPVGYQRATKAAQKILSKLRS